MDKTTLTHRLKQAASELGFELAGVCAAVTPEGITRFRQWLAAGYAGQMRYLPDRAAAYEHPRSVLQGVRSLLMLAMPYDAGPAAPANDGTGRVARYAWGQVDYHDLIHDRLRQLLAQLKQLRPEARARGVVDTAPLLEREFAQLAGLGWAGKNTLLLNTRLGSYFFLAALLTDAELDYDSPHQIDHCGSCTACLDACPTKAFPQPYVLDATRCISYLTIELRESIPTPLRGAMGDWVFGCDICQEVCPWNRHGRPARQQPLQAVPQLRPLELTGLFELTDEQFRLKFRHTPLWRARRRGILRGAAIVLGNQRCHDATAALVTGLHDAEPLVRSSSAWALGQLDSPAARSALRQRLVLEQDPQVLQEIRQAQSGR